MKIRENEVYPEVRKQFSFEEDMYIKYIELERIVKDYKKMKYSDDDKSISDTIEFRDGFIAGVKLMSSIFLDM